MNMTPCKFFIGLLTGILLFSSSTVFGIETKIMVRAKAKDAKFIGSSLGGAYVIIRNTVNGVILAEGTTAGSTGNTDLIMNGQQGRYDRIADAETAGFLGVIDIDDPQFVRIEVVAPVNYKNARVHAATELWLIPGKHLLGDGVIIEIPGFIVDVVTPGTHQYLALKSVVKSGITLKANIVMMCGCIITEGGLWDAGEIEVKAILKRDGVFWKTLNMQLESPNLFHQQLLVAEQGNYEATIYAYHQKSGNTGVDKVNFVVY